MAPQDLEDLPFESPPAKRVRTGESEEEDLKPNMPLSIDDTDEITRNENTLDRPAELQFESPNNVSHLHIKAEDVGSIPGFGTFGGLKLAETTNDELDHKSNSVPAAIQYGVRSSEELEPQEAVRNPTAEAPTADNDNSALLSHDDSPPVTSALEAMLGGITPPSVETVAAVSNVQEDGMVELQFADAAAASVSEEPSRPSMPIPNELPVNTHEMPSTIGTSDIEMDGEDGNDKVEFEVDSSPIESSSDDSDLDDSSSEESEGDDAYKLLGPEEQARILMEGDGGSDDEGGGKGSKGPGGQLRTKNEVPEEVIPKPNVVVTEGMKIEELGRVEAIVENTLLIKAKISGEYRVLESGSVLCTENRDVIGVVSETLGRVHEPLYSVRFTNATEISEAGLVVGTHIYYSQQHSTYVFTQALKAYKGSDASNLHDEEVGDEEIEFSDDEAEMEHRRRIKQKKLEKRGGRMQQIASGRGGHPLQQEHLPSNSSVGLNYDDGEDDGPYKILTRPAGYADSVGRSEAPQEGSDFVGRTRHKEDNGAQHQSRESYGGRGLGDRGRGRGDRGRGQDRGRGRGGFERRGNGNNDYSQPPQSYRNTTASAANPSQEPRWNNFTQATQQYPTMHNFGQNDNSNFRDIGNNSPYSPQPQPFAAQLFPQTFQQPTAQQFQNPHAIPSWPQPSSSTGTYINPAFFGQQQAAGQAWNPYSPAWTPPQQQQQLQHEQQDAARAFAEAQEKLNILKSLSGNR